MDAQTDMTRYFGSRDADRRRTDRARTWNASDLTDLHKEIARRHFLGQKNKVIAEDLGCTPQTVSNVVNSPVVRDLVGTMQGAADAKAVDLATQIKNTAPKALQVLTQLLEDGQTKPALQAKVAMDILDRAGYAPTKNVNMLSMHGHLTPADLDELKARARGTVIDAEVV